MITQHYISQILHNDNEMVKLYALVDGIQYERLFDEPLKNSQGICSLFTIPEDKNLDFAGPWLIDISTLTPEVFQKINMLENKYPAVSWIIAKQTFGTLVHHLGQCLTVSFPTKQTGLLRFYDCRVLNILPDLLSPMQIHILMNNIYKWIFLYQEGIKIYSYNNYSLVIKTIANSFNAKEILS